ncbi:protein tyrosine phosphatase [Desulfacinum hydrothermale DSM 13146]|uniref:Protein tyrosine phosphatase n=1 Tax=Desulfacinum hydrothermale DSM 13146 TaxID=1121390 RepID=A0A1W1XJF1_9BACT|nr:arsenate reductase ArsC [Desulfacinum hydrothermale]SMC23651.1 protein tyrosine phosphatase [Desulfacinum hydrothermale DSM 13146]
MKKVLYICRHNSGRSVMAQAFTNALGRGRVEAESAGLEPRPVLANVVQVMREEGLDVSGHRPQSVFDLYREGRRYDVVITVCDDAHEAECPIFPGIALRDHWPFPDPSRASGSPDEQLAYVRTIRDAIKHKVLNWLESDPLSR